MALAGVRDLAVVETDDVVLVSDLAAPRRHELVAKLKARRIAAKRSHKVCSAPGASIKVLHEGPGCRSSA